MKRIKYLNLKIVQPQQNYNRNLTKKYDLEDHSFSTYAKFSEKLTFLTP